MKAIELIAKKYEKKSIPEFRVGDQVKINLKVQEGEKTRTQVFAGTVIRRRGTGTGATFTVLKESRGGETVEKVFPLHSPSIEKIAVTLKGRVNRSRLYYLRSKR